jgi:hypothetical protein
VGLGLRGVLRRLCLDYVSLPLLVLICEPIIKVEYSDMDRQEQTVELGYGQGVKMTWVKAGTLHAGARGQLVARRRHRPDGGSMT